MNADELLARCPRCDGELGLDQMGCATCWSCDKEIRENADNLWKATETFVDEVAIPILDQDYEVVILKKGGWEQIRSSLGKVKK